MSSVNFLTLVSNISFYSILQDNSNISENIYNIRPRQLSYIAAILSFLSSWLVAEKCIFYKQNQNFLKDMYECTLKIIRWFKKGTAI